MITTKETEANTLQKIRRMVADLGENSYVGAAFDGCFDLAEENIHNDWCLSWKEKYDSLQKDMDELTAEAETLRKENDSMQKDMDGLTAEAETLREENDSMQKKMKELSEPIQDNFTGKETQILLDMLNTKIEDEMRNINDSIDLMKLSSDHKETDALMDAVSQAGAIAKRIEEYNAIQVKVIRRRQHE